tara:strand:+ start:63257 stop:63853 length:597 start_codon:yes stop_codon:yes gene_type:complete
MNETIRKGLRLNAVTGPKVTNPAVSPDTLRELDHEYYGFLQIYTLKSNKGVWHGQLSNIGMQYTIPFAILMPPSLTEHLQLNNNDTIVLNPSPLSEAYSLYYTVIREVTPEDETLPLLFRGAEIGEHTRYLFHGQVIDLLTWEPEGCFYGPGTTMIKTDHVPSLSFTPENQAEQVVTDLEITAPVNSNQNGNNNETPN